MKSSFVFFHLVFSLVIPISSYSMEEPPHPKYKLGKAMVLSTTMQRLSNKLCDQAIRSAPKFIQNKSKLLWNPETVNLALSSTMLLHGPSGTGKTTLARALAQGMDRDYLFVEASNLGTTYKNSAVMGLVNAGMIATEMNLSVIIDEVDRLWKVQDTKKNDDNTPTALWQLIDKLKDKKLLFIGTTNNLSGMPDPLQRRFRGEDYEIPIAITDTQRKDSLLLLLNGKAYDYEQSLDLLSKKTQGLSNGDLSKIIQIASEKAAARDYKKIIITKDDFLSSLQDLKDSDIRLKKDVWDSKEALETVARYVGIIANVVGILNILYSIYRSEQNARMSYKQYEATLTNIVLQKFGLRQNKKIAEKGFELTRSGQNMSHEDSIASREQTQNLSDRSYTQTERLSDRSHTQSKEHADRSHQDSQNSLQQGSYYGDLNAASSKEGLDIQKRAEATNLNPLVQLARVNDAVTKTRAIRALSLKANYLTDYCSFGLYSWLKKWVSDPESPQARAEMTPEQKLEWQNFKKAHAI